MQPGSHSPWAARPARRPPLRTLRPWRAADRIARGQPHRTFVFYGATAIRHPDGPGPGRAGRQFGFTSSLTAQMLKTCCRNCQPHLYPQPPAPSKAAPEVRRSTRAGTGCTAVVVPRQPMKETPDGPTRQPTQRSNSRRRPRAASPKTLNPASCCRSAVPEPEPAPTARRLTPGWDRAQIEYAETLLL